MTTKVCSKCKVEKDVGEFAKDKHKKSGVVSQCKACKHEKYWSDPLINHRPSYPPTTDKTKTCHRCNKEKGVDCFGRSIQTKDGLSNICKTCHHDGYITNNPDVRRRVFSICADGKKLCTDCNTVKPISSFAKDTRDAKRGGSGYRNICKGCDKERREQHKPQIAKYLAGRLQHNRARDRLYKINNAEKISRYYWENKDAISSHHREYRKTPEGKFAVSRGKHIRRTHEEKNKNTLTHNQWIRILTMQQNRCNDCNREFTSELIPTKDHIIPVSRGGSFTFGNVQALCASCNSKKRNKVYIANAITDLLVEPSC